MNKKLVVFIINPKSGVERVKELKQLILSTLHLDEFDYEEIEMDLATFKRHRKVLFKLWEQVQQHMAVYAIDIDSHLGHYYLKSLMDIFNKALETANDNIDEDEDENVCMVSYEYDDDSIEFLENLENSDFFS